MAHTPHEILAKNFGISQSALRGLPSKERFIFQADLPPSLEIDKRAAANTSSPSPVAFDYRPKQQPLTRRTKGGEVRVVDSTLFKVSTSVAMAQVTIHPGGVRELHWHPNADEWQYFISGKGRMTVFATGGRARTADFQAGDVGYVQKTLPHFIENTGDTDLKFLEMFKSSYYQDFSLSQWLAHTPPGLVAAHLGLDKSTLDRIPKQAPLIMPAS
jgi:oxalate decarboxylase